MFDIHRYSWREFINESDNVLTFADFRNIVNDASESECRNIGTKLFDTFFEDEDTCDFSKACVLDMLDQLEEQTDRDTINIVSDIMDSCLADDDDFDSLDNVDESDDESDDDFDYQDEIDYDDDDDDDDDEQLEESVSKVFGSQNKNRNRKLKFKKSLATLKKEYAQRQRQNRATFSARRIYNRINKINKKLYNKGRRQAIKKGQHYVKTRRKTGDA